MKELIKETGEMALGITAVGVMVVTFLTMLNAGGAISRAIEMFMDGIC